MDLYTNERTHHIYSFGQLCLTLLTSCMKITYDNNNTTRINEALVSNCFATIILDICATTWLLITIIINIIIIIYILHNNNNNNNFTLISRL